LINLHTIMKHIMPCIRERKHWEYKSPLSDPQLSISIDKDEKGGYGGTIRLAEVLEHKHFDDIIDVVNWVWNTVHHMRCRLEHLVHNVVRFEEAVSAPLGRHISETLKMPPLSSTPPAS